ncbi:cytochrome c-type biogenesis protein [Magnetospirillum molischianum]|uniref:Cytochrome c-type biogenesis protein n=1 Tax=Magnetospirillum molischianum DSM 120 TaxID=1150626 RepID=H8FVX6_MAGML|nr:cytochrome c-type biogenesis protein [Magnetospirillum molischianum]CCG42514.1 Cytochrome c-type biogenesis protein cycL precursor [Magnetospirillum molischianum DSM 120]
MRLLALCALLLGLNAATPALAVNPDEMLKDPAQEARARELGRELRCVVCQNQSIDDSDADLARDLRLIVRERIDKGDTDNDVRRFLVERYGDYVLLKPPFKQTTLALWLGPPVLLLVGAGMVALFYRRRRRTSVPPAVEVPLTPEEQRRLDRLMKETGQ